MSRACLAFAFAVASIILMPVVVQAQPNSEKASQLPGRPPEPPEPPKAIKDSLKASKGKAKAKKSKATAAATPAAADSAASAPAAAAPAVTPAAPATGSAPSSAPKAIDTAAARKSLDTAKAAAAAPLDTVKPAVDMLAESKVAPKRAPQDIRLFNDPSLIGREYGFGILGSLVAGTLGFYIGSGIETAIVGESRAHKGTLAFKGIRYDNFKGAFWGGSTGLVLGSALTTYFTGQVDEEDGGFFMTLLGTTAASAGAFYLASAMGVNDDIDWPAFIPLLAVPSLGGTLGFNVSRWYHDREREDVVGKEAGLRLHAPSLAIGFAPGGERVELRALHLTF